VVTSPGLSKELRTIHPEVIVPGDPDRESILKKSPLLFFSVFGAISVVLWWNPLRSSLALALYDERYTHLLLIIPVSAALIFLDWKSPASGDRSGVIIGSALLAAAFAMSAVIRWKLTTPFVDTGLSLNMLAFVLWWIAAFIFCFGTRMFHSSLFPLCFLFWLVPLPEFILGAIIRLLQQGSAKAAYLLFVAARVPVEQRGLLLHIPDLILAVAPECSSIRSSLMLVVTTMVLAQLLLRSPWRKAFVVAVAIPLSIAKNGLRIFTIGMLGTRVDPSYLTGRLHRQGGIIFFLIAVAATFLLLWIVRRGERRTESRAQLTA
jgi:exosortase